MRILLDESLPEGLIEPLRHLGHIVDSVGSLGLKGLDNGRLYREVAARYDLFFTKDCAVAAWVETLAERARVRVIHGHPPATRRSVRCFISRSVRVDRLDQILSCARVADIPVGDDGLWGASGRGAAPLRGTD